MTGPQVRFHDGQVAGLTDAQLRAIGLIITNWSATEHICTRIIGAFMKADLVASAIATSGMQSRTLIHIFRLLALATFPGEQAQVGKLYRRLERALEIRNEAAHAKWSALFTSIPGDGRVTAEIRKVKYASKLGFTLRAEREYSVHQLQRKSLFIHGVSWKLLDFIEDHELLGMKKRPPE